LASGSAHHQRDDTGPESSPAGRSLGLTADLRITLFAVIFALGALHHEIQFILEQQRIGPFTQFLDLWRQAKPTIGWSSEVGVFLHLANIVISLLILVLPWRRELLCLLAVTFWLSQLASPERIASHNSLAAGGLALVLIFGLAEWVERALLRGRPERLSTDWINWTLRGLIAVCSLTYLFAALHKLSPTVFWPASSQVTSFLLPYARALGLPAEAARMLLGYPAIFITVALELLLPFLLLAPRTRLLGCLLGVLFHLGMMGQGILDFPTAILAFYPAFLSQAEAQTLLRRFLAPPSPVRLLATLALGLAGIAAIRQAAQPARLHAGGPNVDPGLVFSHNVLMYLTFLLFAHLALALVSQLLKERRRPASPQGVPPASYA
jgi:hypothetical protein